MIYALYQHITMFDFDHTKDFYKILGVEQNASEDDIKKTFRKAAMKHHPDKWWDAEKFKQINEAYQVLWDTQKKAQYDNIRQWWWGFGGGWGFDFWGFWWGGFGGWGFQVDGFGDVWDIIEQLMWWGRSNRPKRGQDIQLVLKVNFEDVYHGKKTKISYTKTSYEWQNRKPVSQEIDISIPAGIEHGQYLKYPGMWDGWRNWWPDWDLYLQISINSHPTFTRKWDDIYQTVSISIFDIVLWEEITIPHPDGSTSVTIPAGTQPGELVRVRGKGMKKPWVFTANGDMMISLKITSPKKLTKEQQKLREQLKNLK